MGAPTTYDHGENRQTQRDCPAIIGAVADQQFWRDVDMSKSLSATASSLNLAGIGQLARAMLDQLPKPLVIGLVGTLGAGKTTLVQSIASAAGVDSSDVTSPTFTLLQSHQGVLTLHHLDAYRIADEDEFLELGVEELFEDDEAWTLIEWADRVVTVMPDQTLWIEISIDNDSSHRTLTFTTTNAETARAVHRMLDAVQAS